MLLDKPFPIFLDELAVELDPAALAQVLDDVPVQLADILAADLRKPVSERDVASTKPSGAGIETSRSPNL